MISVLLNNKVMEIIKRHKAAPALYLFIIDDNHDDENT